MIRRGAFLALGAAAALAPIAARSQDDADPAVMARSPSLRVLLGPGSANPLPGGAGFTFDGRSYRGSFVRSADGSVINLVDLEQYLYSVVPHEMSPSWPVAALAAQAVCARTYVLQRSNPKRDYDLRPSEADQVYGGIATESPAGRAAVDATAGQVLRYGGGFASHRLFVVLRGTHRVVVGCVGRRAASLFERRRMPVVRGFTELSLGQLGRLRSDRAKLWRSRRVRRAARRPHRRHGCERPGAQLRPRRRSRHVSGERQRVPAWGRRARHPKPAHHPADAGQGKHRYRRGRSRARRWAMPMGCARNGGRRETG